MKILVQDIPGAGIFIKTMKKKIIRWTLTIMLCGTLLLLVVTLAAWLAARHKPTFYRAALAIQAESLREDSDNAIRRVTELFNQTQRKEENWDFVITEAEMNGWFAVDLPRNHARSLPTGVTNPRVSIVSNQVSLAVMYEHGAFSGVLVLRLSVHMQEPNLLLFRLRNVQVGAIPFSKRQAIGLLADGFRQSGLNVEETEEAGDPAIRIRLNPRSANGLPIILDTVRAEDHAIWLSGSTGRKE